MSVTLGMPTMPAARTNVLTDVVLNPKSGNGKTGPIPTLNRPIKASCPRTCPFLPKNLGGNGLCYANGMINAAASGAAGTTTTDAIVDRINAGKHKAGGKVKGETFGAPKYIRDRVVGDIVVDPDGDARADVDYVLNVGEIGRRVGMVPYGYTHAYDMLSTEDVAAIAASGYVLNGSANSVEDVERILALGLPATIATDDVADGTMISGKRVVQCPEQTGRVRSCADCGLCAKPDRAAIVRFAIH